MEKISRATGAKIISNLNEINYADFGKAMSVDEVKIADDSLIYVRGCLNPRAVTIVARGGTEHVVDEIERSIMDALGDVISAVKSGKVVSGGGAIEMELSRRLKTFAKTLGGREQLAVEEFAHSLESIPETLAENAGLDPIDTITDLRRRHEAGSLRDGLNLFSNRIEDTFAAGIIEPLKIKTQAISSATEVSTMILRIDDVLISSGKQDKEKQQSYELE